MCYTFAESCILSKFYIKPQPRVPRLIVSTVVSYRNSTSNHNVARVMNPGVKVVSYRNSTSNHNHLVREEDQPQLYLIEILHQTTTSVDGWGSIQSCILSKFYIKPQLWAMFAMLFGVVSYRNSTSNHNIARVMNPGVKVVSYRNSTSNHNAVQCST